MGGDAVSSLISSSESELAEEESLLEQDFAQFSFGAPTTSRDGSVEKMENGNVNGENWPVFKRCDDVAHQIPSQSSDLKDYERKRRARVYRRISESYNELQGRIEHLEVAKSKILSYYPGAWIEMVGGMKLSDYDVPNTTTLLLVGPKGSGKSSLVNRISRVFEDDQFATDRAQLSNNYSAGHGTYFLQEYMIPRGSSSFCLYDTRSLSENSSENMEMLKRWMTRGVCHGELVKRDSDSSSLKDVMKYKARQTGYHCIEIRMVNFVVFVVNGLSIWRSMEGDDVAKQYTEMVATAYNLPFLSFRDDKPVVVVTHGDLLSQSDRASVRLYLGDLLGIPPTEQIFDIPENCNQVTELAIVDMLRYCLEHSDRNLGGKDIISSKVLRSSISKCLLLLVVLGIAITAAYFSHTYMHRFHKRRASPLSSHLDWHLIRHLWLGVGYD